MRLEASHSTSRGSQQVPRSIHLMTLVLALITALALAVAQADYGLNLTSWLVLLGQFVVTGLAAYGFRRIASEWSEPPAVTPILVALALLSYIREPIQRLLFETGRPFEMIAMHSLRDLVLGLAAAACWRQFQRITVLMSLFLILFSAAIARERVVAVLCATYGILCLATLGATYWETLRPRLLAQDQARTSRRWILIGASLLILTALTQTPAGKPLMRVMQGIVPSSGGDGSSSVYARDGVGDGETLVAGMDDIRTFGPIEDAPFISDHKPSLYDVFDDRYDEPVKLPKNQDRAIALSAEQAAKIQERHLKDNQTVSRDFSVLRQPRKGQTQKKSAGVRSNALLYVSGRTPLHLRMELYDRFDGVDWQPEELPLATQFPQLRMQTVDDRPWVMCDLHTNLFDVLAEPETHALKIIRLDSPRIPSPLNLTGVHIDQVNTESMYARSQFGLLQMERKTLPEMVPIHLCSSPLDRRRVPEEFAVLTGGSPHHRFVPAIEGMGRIKDLATQWTAGVPRGWQQVETIARRLREKYQLDDEWRPEAGCPSPVAHFLFISRRGPDYLFASSAALMLRSLGYSTRVVTGFYADPRQFDRKSGHTPVTKEDAHTWVECSLGANYWATVEATPGYEVLDPPPSLIARLFAAVQRLGLWVWDHRLPASAVLGGVLLALAFRRALADLYRTAVWRWRVESDPRQRVLATVQLLEKRLAGCGEPRPAAATLTTWLNRTKLQNTSVGTALRQLSPLAEWARYGGSSLPPASGQIHTLCRNVERSVNRSAIRRSLRPASAAGRSPLSAGVPT